MKKTPPASGRAVTEGTSLKTLSKCYLSKPKTALFYQGTANTQRCSSIHGNSNTNNNNNNENMHQSSTTTCQAGGQIIPAQRNARLSMEPMQSNQQSSQMRILYQLNSGQKQTQKQQQQQQQPAACFGQNLLSSPKDARYRMNSPLSAIQQQYGLSSQIASQPPNPYQQHILTGMLSTSKKNKTDFQRCQTSYLLTEEQLIFENDLTSKRKSMGIPNSYQTSTCLNKSILGNRRASGLPSSVSTCSNTRRSAGSSIHQKNNANNDKKAIFNSEINNESESNRNPSNPIEALCAALKQTNNMKHHDYNQINYAKQLGLLSAQKQPYQKDRIDLDLLNKLKNCGGTVENDEEGNNTNNTLTERMQGTEEDEDLDDHAKSFFCREEDEQHPKQSTFVNRIPVSPKKKHKPNNELDFFCHNNNFKQSHPSDCNSSALPHNNSLIPPFFPHPFSLQKATPLVRTSNRRCETVANCEENQQINNQQISRKIVNKSLLSKEDKKGEQFILLSQSPLGRLQQQQSPSQDNNIDSTSASSRSILESISVNLKNVFKSLGQNNQGIANTTSMHGISKRTQCQCDGSMNLLNGQTCQRAYKWLQSLFPENDLENLKRMYQQIKSSSVGIVDIQVVQQIEKDIGRTYPDLPFFNPKKNLANIIQSGQQPLTPVSQLEQTTPEYSKIVDENISGFDLLRSVLISFAAYDPQVGYVQGLNFIAAHFLFHAEEHIAFWLLVNTFERFEMRDIFLPNLPGLRKHCSILEQIIWEIDQQIAEHFVNNGIQSEMYMTPWLLSLFGMMIPLQFLDVFFEKMIAEGWCYFYKFILSYLADNRQLLLESDFMGIMSLLSSKNNQIFKQQTEKSDKHWLGLITTGADRIPLKQHYIQHLIDSFTVEAQ